MAANANIQQPVVNADPRVPGLYRMTRHSTGEHFSVVLDTFPTRDELRILLTADRRNLTPGQATVFAMGFRRAGLVVHPSVILRVPNYTIPPPNLRTFLSSTPISESRAEIRNYATERDRVHGNLAYGDNGALMGNHGQDFQLAQTMGLAVGRVPLEHTDPREARITSLEADLAEVKTLLNELCTGPNSPQATKARINTAVTNSPAVARVLFG